MNICLIEFDCVQGGPDARIGAFLLMSASSSKSRFSGGI